MALLLLSIFTLLLSLSTASPFPNSTVPFHHRNAEAVVRDLNQRVESSRRRALETVRKDQQHCPTGNPIDDCWLCSTSDWRTDRQRLADCGIGFGGDALGGKGGPIYIVTDSSDNDAVNPTPGTLRHAAMQEGPLWITFSSSMTIHLAEELMVNSFKTIDARGANVHIAGGACITIQYVSNIIIHGLHIHDCVPAGEANVRSTPTHSGFRSKSDGDGISIYGSRKIWIDHCELSHCADGLIDAIMGSSAITISNNLFYNHNDVMLMGGSDEYEPDIGMQVTIAFNRFGAGLVQRMPRCRLGYFHIVNNDYTEWEMYAIGGSAAPTINSQGNRYIAPGDGHAKEVTKRVDMEQGGWEGWNWRSDGDVMVNGAFFVASGEGLGAKFEKAESMEPRTAAMVEELTANAGVLGGAGSSSSKTGSSAADSGSGNGNDNPALEVGGGGGGGARGYNVLGMMYGSGSPPLSTMLLMSVCVAVAMFWFAC